MLLDENRFRRDKTVFFTQSVGYITAPPVPRLTKILPLRQHPKHPKTMPNSEEQQNGAETQVKEQTEGQAPAEQKAADGQKCAEHQQCEKDCAKDSAGDGQPQEQSQQS